MENKNFVADGTTGGGAGIINEASLDAWIGTGGDLTQSSDPNATGYYEGVGSLGNYVDPDTGGAADEDTTNLFNLYKDKFGRNPDAEGLDYWEERMDDGMELSAIADSFDASVENELRNITPVDQGGNAPASYGGGTEATNFITNQDNYEKEQAERAANITHSTTATGSDTVSEVDKFLNDLYAEAGINQGKVDQGGRDYWTKQLQNKSQEEVRKDILWAAANN